VAKEGEKILVVEADLTGGDYENGDILTVRRVGWAGLKVSEHDTAILHEEYEVIVSEEEEPEDPRDEFSKGDQVRLISGGGSYPLNGYYDGNVYEVVEPKYDDHDHSPVLQIKGGRHQTGYAKAHQVELDENPPLKVGDFARATGNTYWGDIDKGTVVKIMRGMDGDGDFMIELLDGSDRDFAKPENLEKVDPSDRELSFIRAGREVDELEVGDIAEVVESKGASPVGSLVEITRGWSGGVYAKGVSRVNNDLMEYAYNEGRLKLVCPENKRVDVVDSDD